MRASSDVLLVAPDAARPGLRRSTSRQIMKVADAEEAIRLANDSAYGLCAAVFSRDTKRAEAIARRIEASAVNVNDALGNFTALELPMGGGKPGSGIGHRHGPGGIRKHCRRQSLLVSRFHPKRAPLMYP
jgi:acyl-CoA reductase-like NAD-dependent aldehyde dehydrogenase